MTDVGADAAAAVVVKLVLLWSDTTALEGETARKHTHQESDVGQLSGETRRASDRT